MRVEAIESFIRTVPDFPKPGILFYDIAPLLQNPQAFRQSIDLLVSEVTQPIKFVCGVEARGFILGAAVADRIGAGFVMVRKPGKLPGETIERRYGLEYGENVLQISDTAKRLEGQDVLLVDDVLATGGTAEAAKGLLEQVGAKVSTMLFLIELTGLGGRERLGEGVRSILSFPA